MSSLAPDGTSPLKSLVVQEGLGSYSDVSGCCRYSGTSDMVCIYHDCDRLESRFLLDSQSGLV